MMIGQEWMAIIVGALLVGLSVGSTPIRGTDPIPGSLQILTTLAVFALLVIFARRSDFAHPHFTSGFVLGIGLVSLLYAPLSGQVVNPAAMATWAAKVATQGFALGTGLAVAAFGLVDVALEREWSGDLFVPRTREDWWYVAAFVSLSTAAFLASIVAPEPLASLVTGVLALGCAMGVAVQSGIRRYYLLFAALANLGVFVSVVSYDGGVTFVTLGVVIAVASETVGGKPSLATAVALWGGLLLGSFMFLTGGPV